MPNFAGIGSGAPGMGMASGGPGGGLVGGGLGAYGGLTGAYPSDPAWPMSEMMVQNNFRNQNPLSALINSGVDLGRAQWGLVNAGDYGPGGRFGPNGPGLAPAELARRLAAQEAQEKAKRQTKQAMEQKAVDAAIAKMLKNMLTGK